MVPQQTNKHRGLHIHQPNLSHLTSMYTIYWISSMQNVWMHVNATWIMSLYWCRDCLPFRSLYLRLSSQRCDNISHSVRLDPGTPRESRRTAGTWADISRNVPLNWGKSKGWLMVKYIHIYIYIHTCLCICICICICLYVCNYMCIYIHICTRVYIYIYVYIYTYIYMLI